MNRMRERILWISTTSAILLILGAVLFSPVASAQSSRNRADQDYIQEIEDALQTLQTYFVDEVDPQVLFKAAINGMFDALDDPHSVYLDEAFLERMTDTTKGKYGGVGLYISRDRYDSDDAVGRLPYVKVVSPIEDTPGWRAGINAGDYIYAIEDESAEDFTTQEVSDRLRGIPGSKVRVTILRGNDITFDVVLSREEIEIPTVKTTIINDSIGYLRIIEFTPFTASRVKETLSELDSLKLDKLIVDVRSNPGGLLDSVVNVANLFFSDGVIVSTRYRQEQQNKTHRAKPGKLVPSDMDIVVLIDRGSASASEILTGALKDRERAIIIGEKSFGKGSIQQIIPLRSTNAAIKLTTGRYYTPDGNDIDKIGIEPDIFVEEEELTEIQSKAYATILKENRIGNFINTNTNPTKAEINSFVRAIQAEGLDPGERTLRLLIKREAGRRLNIPPVVDLEYDRPLIRAIEYLETGQ